MSVVSSQPWDFNDSFGQSWRVTRRPAARSPDRFVDRNHLFERLVTNPDTRQPLVERYQAALRGPWAVDAILERVDTLSAQIYPVALRDERKWGTAYAEHFAAAPELTTHEQEVEYLRQWISERWAYVSAYYENPPTTEEARAAEALEGGDAASGSPAEGRGADDSASQDGGSNGGGSDDGGSNGGGSDDGDPGDGGSSLRSPTE